MSEISVIFFTLFWVKNKAGNDHLTLFGSIYESSVIIKPEVSPEYENGEFEFFPIHDISLNYI